MRPHSADDVGKQDGILRNQPRFQHGVHVLGALRHIVGAVLLEELPFFGCEVMGPVLSVTDHSARLLLPGAEQLRQPGVALVPQSGQANPSGDGHCVEAQVRHNPVMLGEDERVEPVEVVPHNDAVLAVRKVEGLEHGGYLMRLEHLSLAPVNADAHELDFKPGVANVFNRPHLAQGIILMPPVGFIVDCDYMHNVAPVYGPPKGAALLSGTQP